MSIAPTTGAGGVLPQTTAAAQTQTAAPATTATGTPAFNFIEILKDPKQAQAFQELIAMAVVASQQLMQQYGGVAADPAAQKAAEENQKAQMAYYQEGIKNAYAASDYWKGNMQAQLNLGSTVGVQVPSGGYGPEAFAPGGIFGI